MWSLVRGLMENDRQPWVNFPLLQFECLEVAGVPASASESKVEQNVTTFLMKLSWFIGNFTISWHHPVG